MIQVTRVVKLRSNRMTQKETAQDTDLVTWIRMKGIFEETWQNEARGCYLCGWGIRLAKHGIHVLTSGPKYIMGCVAVV